MQRSKGGRAARVESKRREGARGVRSLEQEQEGGEQEFGARGRGGSKSQSIEQEGEEQEEGAREKSQIFLINPKTFSKLNTVALNSSPPPHSILLL